MHQEKSEQSKKDKSPNVGQTFRMRIQEWVDFEWSSLSVEPVAWLMMTSVLLSYLIFQNVMRDNICRVSFNFSKEFCHKIRQDPETYSNETSDITTILGKTITYRSILDSSFPVIFVIFAGPWSDFYGRKIPLMLSVLGFTLQNVLYLIVSQVCIDSANPYLLNTLVTLPKCFGGGEIAYTMAAYAYLSDITTLSARTFRHGLLNSSYLLGVPTGLALGGLLIDHGVSYVTSFAISIALSTTGLVILFFRTKNTTKADRLAMDEVDSDDNNYDQLSLGPNPTWCDVLNLKNSLFKVVMLPFKKRENNGRIKLLLLLIAFICSAAPIFGEFRVMYIFVVDNIKGWDAPEYGYFNTFNTLVGVAGVILSMGILSKFLKLSDPLVGFITGTSQMAGSVVYAFATTGTMMYIASSIDMMNGTMVVITRSMMSKIVELTEVGKLFSLVAILESLTPLVIEPTYTQVYLASKEAKLGTPEIFYLISVALTIPPQIIFLWFIYKNYNSNMSKPTSTPSSLSVPIINVISPNGTLNGGYDNTAFSSDDIVQIDRHHIHSESG